MTKLSVITVTYNSQDKLNQYFSSLISNLPKNSEVILVDSGSTDNTLTALREYHKKHTFIKVIDAGKNVGFGGGNNLGLKEAEGEYILFLNPDTKVKKGAIEALLDYISGQNGVGIVAPQLVEPTGKIQPSVRNLPSLARAWQEYIFHQKNAYEPYAPTGIEPQEVESVVGAGMMIKKELYLRIGGFDPKFFMYYEDIDLCRKVRKLGLKVVYLPSAVIEHEVGGSISALKAGWLKQSALAYHGFFEYSLLWMLFQAIRVFRKLR